MPLTFLCLPREIRDQIYLETLGSKTGIVIFLPSPYSTSLQSPTKPFQPTITTQPTEKLPQNPLSCINKKLIIQEFTPWAHREYTLSSAQRITLNITQTCRQVHSEMKGMFWAANRVWGGGVGMWKLVQEVRLKEWENIEDGTKVAEGRLVEINQSGMLGV